MFFQPGIDRDLVAAEWDQGHGFGPAGNDDVGASSADSVGGEGDGLQARCAVAVDGHGRGFDGQAGAERADARYILTLLGFRHGAADDDVLDFLLVQAGHALKRALDGESAQVVGPRGTQGAFGGLADGGTDGTYNDCFSHFDPSSAQHYSILLYTTGRADPRSARVPLDPLRLEGTIACHTQKAGQGAGRGPGVRPTSKAGGKTASAT
jgi:hypothetical protein